MNTYVVGFLFNNEKTDVVLIKKNHPEWQAGKFNGVGGHIETGETAQHAMSREFVEETGLRIDTRKWDNFLTCQYKDSIVYFFRAFAQSRELLDVQSTTDEEVMILSVDFINSGRVIPNLKWIIPLALDNFLNTTNSHF